MSFEQKIKFVFKEPHKNFKLVNIIEDYQFISQIWTTRHQDKTVSILWTGLCLVLAVFTFLPTVGKDSDFSLVRPHPFSDTL